MNRADAVLLLSGGGLWAYGGTANDPVAVNIGFLCVMVAVGFLR